jgi:dTDP-4-amino-4,6-dideoxygalactose transaminase
MINSFDYLDDLKKIYPSIINSIQKVLKSGNLILGPQVELFEKKFSNFLGTKYGLGVGNCTDAIYISLKTKKITVTIYIRAKMTKTRCITHMQIYKEWGGR